MRGAPHNAAGTIHARFYKGFCIRQLCQPGGTRVVKPCKDNIAVSSGQRVDRAAYSLLPDSMLHTFSCGGYLEKRNIKSHMTPWTDFPDSFHILTPFLHSRHRLRETNTPSTNIC